MTQTLTHLSPSKLTTYMTCPIKFYARYILGVRGPVTVNMILGRAVHSALEHLGRRRQLEMPVTFDDVLTEFHDSWKHELEDADPEDLDPKKVDKALSGAEPMLKAYWDEYSEERPTACELRLEEPLAAAGIGEVGLYADLSMVGIIDSLVAEDDGLVIVDYKTTARTSSPATLNLIHRIQLLAYAYLLERASETKVKALEIRQIVNKKVPELAVCRLPVPATLDYTPMFTVIESLLHSLNSDRWMPRYNFMCTTACEGYEQCSLL